MISTRRTTSTGCDRRVGNNTENHSLYHRPPRIIAMVSLLTLGTALAFPSGELRHGHSLREEPTKFYANSAPIVKQISTRTRSRTCLQYRDILNRDGHGSSRRAVEDSGADSEQAVVDDYLKFLDKRYHRLHDEEPEEVDFPVWKWLMKNDATAKKKEESVVVPKAQKEDALYALGVAGLASERLLQKHKVESTALRDEKKASKSIDSETSVVPSAAAFSMVSIIIRRLSPPLRYLGLQRQMLISYGPRALLRSVLVPLKRLLRVTPQVPTKFAKTLLELGGGKRNVMLSVSLMVALISLAQLVFPEGFAFQQA